MYLSSRLKYRLLFFVALIISACSGASDYTSDKAANYNFNGNYYFEIPRDLLDKKLFKERIETYSEYLKGKKIFIDPGHGGKDRRNMSRKSEIVEADVNLAVALKLGNFLSLADADVYFSRTEDKTVDLLERPALANRLGVDLFISIHHNAAAADEDYWTNYTAVYYHAKREDYDYEPYNRELARYIHRDLSFAIMTSGGLGSFDGTYSDFSVYPGMGFAVLREAKPPAVLVECAFHTNRMEEQRLQNQEFNEIEAWGIFKGIAKFYSAERPAIRLNKEKSTLINGNLHLVYNLISEHGIDSLSIRTYFDTTIVRHEFNSAQSELFVNLDNIQPGAHIIKVKFADVKGHYALPYEKKILTKF